MSPHPSTTKVAHIASLLGYTQARPEEIDWANDIPAGRELLDWVAGQLNAPEDEEEDANDMISALSAIALGDDETRLSDFSDQCHEKLSKYMSPARLGAQARYKNRDADILESEMDVLKYRIKQTKVENKRHISLTDQRKQALASVDSELAHTHERLADTTNEADKAVTSARDSALKLIDALAHSCRIDHTADLTRIARRRTTIVDQFQRSCIATMLETALSSEDLQEEANRLDEVLATLHKRIIQTYKVHPGKIDVHEELSQAWNMDQLDALRAREAVLEEAIHAFELEVIAPLTALQEQLAMKATLVADAEAVLGALAEELEDAAGDVEEAETPRVRLQYLRTIVEDSTLPTDLRPPNAAPMVLLNRDDILEEVRLRLKANADSAQHELKKAHTLASDLQTLRASHNTLLHTIYANSPVNTSPPFAPSESTASAERSAQAKKDKLAEGAKILSTELPTLESEKTQRQIDAFIKKAGHVQ
ncbi:hypothetical protein HDZ31DRAFT_84427 [Schizophyllum fasciatum]